MRALAGLAAVLAIALLVPASSPTLDRVDGPTLNVGDTWTYHTNTSLGSRFYFEGHVTLTVASHGPDTVEGVTFDAYRLQVNGAGTAAGTFSAQFGSAPASGNWVVTGHETVESAGLKTVASVLDLEANGTLRKSAVSVLFQLSAQNTTSYRFTQDTWRFPLSVLNATVVRGEMNFSEDFRLFYGLSRTLIHAAGVVAWNVSYAMEAHTAVDTPAGHFDAYRIRQTLPDGTFNLLFYAPGVGNDARTETYNGTEQVARTELTSFRYQALEPPTFFGLMASQWALVAVVVAVLIGGIVLVRRRRRRPEPPIEPPTQPPPVAP